LRIDFETPTGGETVETKRVISIVARIIGISVINFIIWMLVTSVVTKALSIAVHPEIQSVMITAMAMMIVTSFCNAAVLSYTIVRSGFRRWKLVITIFTVYFGVNTFLSQIETLYFNVSLNIPMREVVSFFLTGFITALVFSPLSVLVLGKFRERKVPLHSPARLAASSWGLVARVALIAVVIYPVLYFLFGYFVLWQFEEARVLYSGTSLKLSFFSHMATTVQEDPVIYPWQVLRGLLWILLALPVIRMSRAKWWDTAVQAGLLFAVLMNAGHLIPNPYMPRIVSMAHLIETATSNFILGFITVFFLLRYKNSSRIGGGRENC
jgi:hypothetical protein